MVDTWNGRTEEHMVDGVDEAVTPEADAQAKTSPQYLVKGLLNKHYNECKLNNTSMKKIMLPDARLFPLGSL